VSTSGLIPRDPGATPEGHGTPELGLLAHLGVAACTRIARGRIQRMGPKPPWWDSVSDSDVFDAESLQWASHFAFLGHFLHDAEVAWAEGGDRVVRSGLWAEEFDGAARYFEAEAFTFRGRGLVLIHDLGDRGEEHGELLQAARSSALAADQDAQASARLQAETLRAKERAEALSDAKSSLLANVSHEIRTPLSGIIGLSELMERSEPRSDQVEFLRLIQQSAGSLLEIINDLLDLSKLEANKVEIRPEALDLRRLLADTLGPMAIRAHAKRLELNYRVDSAVPRLVLGDGLRIRQVLVNLVGNAIKFTESGEVAVFVSGQAAGDSVRLHFSVQDTGSGIPADRQQRIFEAFTQADASVVRTHGGTGLGLTISARLVAMMGGHLALRSEPDSGSEFSFTLAFESLSAAAGPTPNSSLAGHRVMILDDCATSRAACADVLTAWGCDVDTVTSPADATARLQSGVDEGRPVLLMVASRALPKAVETEWAEDTLARFAETGLELVLAFATEQRAQLVEWRERHKGRAILKPVGEEKLREALDDLSLAPKPPAEVRSPSREGAGRRVLVADDNAVNRMIVSALLQEHAYEVTAVVDGVEAVRALERDPFDAVLMDVHMPRLDGLQATREIRASEAGGGGRTPILALTAHAGESDRERCLAVGMDGYVSKPIDPAELYRELAQFCSEEARPGESPGEST